MLTHLLLGGLTLTLYVVLTFLAPPGRQLQLVLIGMGYLSLALVVVTLLIGPLRLWQQKRMRHNPVNLFVRRDVGIWAALTGCWHTILVLRGSINTRQLLFFFVQRTSSGGISFFTIYGLSNDAGLLAILLSLLLLALSNTASLRLLKGKRWKQVQRLTYPLALLVVAHTVGFQYLNVRGPLLAGLLLLASVSVLACQGVGIGITLMRRRQMPIREKS